MDFTKEAAENAEQAVDQMFKALSKPKQREYLGHLNEVCLFIEAAKKAAPSEETIQQLAKEEAQAT
jgi:hypothetical protein